MLQAERDLVSLNPAFSSSLKRRTMAVGVPAWGFFHVDSYFKRMLEKT